MKLDMYVNYKRCCREAFDYYTRHLGARLHSMQTFGEMPGGQVPEGGEPTDVIHARLEIGGAVLMGADVPTAEPMRSAYLTLQFGNVEETERAYQALSDGGQVFMPIRQTNFATRFAMLRDKFGASWMLLCQDASHKSS